MKRMLLVIFLVLPSCLFAHTSFTAGELLKDCKADATQVTSTLDDHFSAGICVGYLTGWMDATTDSVIVTENGPARVFFEDGVTVGRLKRVFTQYMNQHPELENQLASRTLTKAVQEAHLAHLEPVKQPPIVKEQ